LEARGCSIAMVNGQACFRGDITPDEAAILRDHREDVRLLVSLLDDDVQARLTVYRAQMTAGLRCLPAFLFRAGVAYVQGVCFSCGDRLDSPRFGRCWPCSFALRLAAQGVRPAVLQALDAARVA
jgi:hypothetical protein